jgi:c(7)-type cytochrome triheme protein
MNHYSLYKRIFSFVLACVILFSCSPEMAGQRIMKQKIDDIYFPDTHYMPPAWFSHEKHIFAGVHCRDCHKKLFPSKKGATDVNNALTMKAMENGKFCGVCHDGGKAFKVVGKHCLKCHVKNK